MLDATAAYVESGTRGFDCNFILSPDKARHYRDQSFAFALRYIRRQHITDHDLTSSEANDILDTGLMLGIVQHVESENSWNPSSAKGEAQAVVAVAELQRIGAPSETQCWLDLEGVNPLVPPKDIVAFCNRWHKILSDAGYETGLYVGWHCGLSATELYHDLAISRYWSAYNLNGDETPAVRGVCMKQYANAGDTSIDVDMVVRDSLGGLPTFLSRN